jgi:hypothetical protein
MFKSADRTGKSPAKEDSPVPDHRRIHARAIQHTAALHKVIGLRSLHAKIEVFELVVKPGKDRRLRIQSDVEAGRNPGNPPKMVNHQIKTGGRQVLGVILFAQLRVKTRHDDMALQAVEKKENVLGYGKAGGDIGNKIIGAGKFKVIG